MSFLPRSIAGSISSPTNPRLISHLCASQYPQPPRGIRPGPTTLEICSLGLELAPWDYDEFLWELRFKESCILTLGGQVTEEPIKSLATTTHTLPILSLDEFNIGSFVSKCSPPALFIFPASKTLSLKATQYWEMGGGFCRVDVLATSVINSFQCHLPMAFTSDHKYLFRKEINQRCSELEVTLEVIQSNSLPDIDLPLQHCQ